jgi:C1A family cysteine protease
MLLRKSIIFTSLLAVFSAQAYYSHDEVVSEFINNKMGIKSQISPERMPASVAQFYTPTLDEVISPETQRKLDSKIKKSTYNFDFVSDSVDLRHRDTEVVSQIGPRCSAYGLIASMENLLGVPEVAQLSQNHLWSAYKRYSSEAAVYAAKRMNITEAQMWPHEVKNPKSGWQAKSHTAITDITYIEDDIARAVKALDAGRPVYIGLSVSRSMGNCDAVLDPSSTPGGGGHAISISGYALDANVPGGGYFILKNSWGQNCGDKGYQYMAFNYCNQGRGAYCIMWDIQGVKTGFPGVASVTPEYEEFDLSKVSIEVNSSKKWYKRARTVAVNISGESIHARQIREVSFRVDGGKIVKNVKNDVDEVNWSFRTRSISHEIAMQIELTNGQVVNKTYHWKL